MAIVPTEVFKHDAVAEEIVNAELDLVLTKGKSVADAIADAERMVARRARR
jgi:multiple sugar transport system substrate-binding protein